MSILGDRIKTLIDEADITQKKLADDLNYKPSTISEWCSGKRDPSASVIIDLADYFHTSTDYILGRTETKKTDVSTLSMADYLGLSDDVIDELHQLSKYRFTPVGYLPESLYEKEINQDLIDLKNKSLLFFLKDSIPRLFNLGSMNIINEIYRERYSEDYDSIIEQLRSTIRSMTKDNWEDIDFIYGHDYRIFDESLFESYFEEELFKNDEEEDSSRSLIYITFKPEEARTNFDGKIYHLQRELVNNLYRIIDPHFEIPILLEKEKTLRELIIKYYGIDNEETE